MLARLEIRCEGFVDLVLEIFLAPGILIGSSVGGLGKLCSMICQFW